MDCSQPGYSIHGILQASILEWVAIPFCQFLSSFFRYFVLFSFFPHIFHSLSFFLFYSFLPMLLFVTYFFFILPFYNFSYFSLLLLSLSQSLSFPLSFSFSFLHSFTLLSYFPLSCSITLKKIFLFFLCTTVPFTSLLSSLSHLTFSIFFSVFLSIKNKTYMFKQKMKQTK